MAGMAGRPKKVSKCFSPRQILGQSNLESFLDCCIAIKEAAEISEN